ncbi:L,D-transpeptidase [Leptolyngbya sp. FACHB-261]|nr:L,D-transpeptidase [Leptolyngbya sp. FACHB-261]
MSSSSDSLTRCWTVLSSGALLLIALVNLQPRIKVDQRAPLQNVKTQTQLITTTEPASSFQWPFSSLWPAPKRRLEVNLSQRQVQLLEGDRVVATYAVAVGMEGWETPAGEFKITQMTQNPGWRHPFTQTIVPPGSPENPLGLYWIGFKTDGPLWIGFHGTNQPDSIGHAVSHGCLRMRNEDISAMYREVRIGTPVIVRL